MGPGWVAFHPSDCYTVQVVLDDGAAPMLPVMRFPLKAGRSKRKTHARLAGLRLSLMPRPGSSVVERGPEKAGVGGSIPSLATTLTAQEIRS